MQELIRKGYVCHPQQLCSLRRVTMAEGKAKGTDIIEVCTAGGLQVDILPDSGLDIGQVRYRGVNMSYICKNGYDSPAIMAPYETEFSNTFSGGLLYTCGLRNVGPAHRDNGEWHPSHGRYHSLAAEHTGAAIEGDEVVVTGTVRESALFGHLLEVRRTIRIPCSGASITLEDTITNLTPRDEELMVIYHCNFGYPMLSEKARLILPEARETTARTEFAQSFIGRECGFDAPIDSEPERVFFHRMRSDFHASLQNPELGVELALSWSGGTLPVLAEWRSMASGDYVLGLEPTNTYILGRSAERENGTLQTLRAFTSVTNRVEFRFADIKD